MQNMTKAEFVGMMKLWKHELTELVKPFDEHQPPLSIDQITRLKLKRISREILEYTEAYEESGL